MNIAVISSVIGFINGAIPENVYTNVFQILGIVTMVIPNNLESKPQSRNRRFLAI